MLKRRFIETRQNRMKTNKLLRKLQSAMGHNFEGVL